MAAKSKREWLNADPSLLACIQYTVDDDGWGTDFTIRDCTRTVTIEFGFNRKEPAKKKKALAKLQRMINFLEEFKDEMEKL